MRGPGHDHFRPLLFPVFFNGDDVSESLEGMPRSCFHTEDRFARVFYELFQDFLPVVVGLALELRERPYPYHIAVAAHHRNSLQKMLGPVPVHHHATLSLEFPCPLVHIQYHHVHPQVHGRFLGAESGAETGVEEQHQ